LSLQHSSFSPKLLARAIASVDEENFDKLKDAYNACMDEDMIKEVGVAPLLDLLNKTKSTFSAEKASASSSNSGLSTTILYLEHLGIAGLVSLGTGADDKDPDNVVIYVNNPRSIGLPAKDYYKDAKVLKNYEDAATQVIGSLLPDNKAYVHDVIELEKKLAASSPDAEDQDDVTVRNLP
jgi:endothelin-converting enzyme